MQMQMQLHGQPCPGVASGFHHPLCTSTSRPLHPRASHSTAVKPGDCQRDFYWKKRFCGGATTITIKCEITAALACRRRWKCSSVCSHLCLCSAAAHLLLSCSWTPVSHLQQPRERLREYLPGGTRVSVATCQQPGSKSKDVCEIF